jgi:hypothetical protein
MATAKDIFDWLQQYPLPAKGGARAHDFFKPFYPTYAANNVVSIEQMFVGGE